MPTPAPEPPKTAEQPAPKRFAPWVRLAAKLTIKDADDLKEPLTAALTDYFKYSDDWLWKLSPADAERPIWSAIDDEDTDKLAEILLKWGKRSEIVSTAIHAFIDSHDGLVLFAILAPPSAETAKILSRRKRRPKP